MAALEEAAWPAPLQGMLPVDIERRIQTFPAGQLVLVDSSDVILGSLYTQRISSTAVLREGGNSFQRSIDFHADNGLVWQLLSIQVQPSHTAKGYGDMLIFHALTMAKAAGVEDVLAVTRCRAWAAARERDPSLDMLWHAERGSDPGISFHTSRGATVLGLVPGWRYEDNENVGTGVLVRYDTRQFLLQRASPERSGIVNVAPLQSGIFTRRPSSAQLLSKMEAATRSLVEAKEAIDFDAPLMEAGLDSYLLPMVSEVSA